MDSGEGEGVVQKGLTRHSPRQLLLPAWSLAQSLLLSCCIQCQAAGRKRHGGSPAVLHPLRTHPIHRYIWYIPYGHIRYINTSDTSPTLKALTSVRWTMKQKRSQDCLSLARNLHRDSASAWAHRPLHSPLFQFSHSLQAPDIFLVLVCLRVKLPKYGGTSDRRACAMCLSKIMPYSRDVWKALQWRIIWLWE